MSGCSSNEKNPKNYVQTGIKPQEKQIAPLPKLEIAETPRFKELKKQKEKVVAEVNKLDYERMRLLTIYTTEAPKVKNILSELEKAKAKLEKIQELFNEESEKIEISVKNNPL